MKIIDHPALSRPVRPSWNLLAPALLLIPALVACVLCPAWWTLLPTAAMVVLVCVKTNWDLLLHPPDPGKGRRQVVDEMAHILARMESAARERQKENELRLKTGIAAIRKLNH